MICLVWFGFQIRFHTYFAQWFSAFYGYYMAALSSGHQLSQCGADVLNTPDFMTLLNICLTYPPLTEVQKKSIYLFNI